MPEPGMSERIHDSGVGRTDVSAGADAPVTTADGRPFIRDPHRKTGDPVFWWPDPPRDGDPVFCMGVRIGTFHGEYLNTSTAFGHWYIRLAPTADMPAKLAAHVRANTSDGRGNLVKA